MANETYYDYINAFYELLKVNPPSPNAQLLYHTLLMEFNSARWQSVELLRTNSYIGGLCGLGDKAMASARNELKQLGLIDFRTTKKKPTAYKLTCGLVEDFTTQRQVKGESTATQRQVKGRIYKEKEKETEKDIRSPLPPYEEIIGSYNDICRDLPKVTSVSDKRRSAIAARLKKYTPEQICEVFRRAHESDFLSGRNDKGWKCSFDWLMNENNMIKVLEGNYDNRAGIGEKSFGVYRDNVDHDELERLMREKYDGGVS